MIAQTSVGQTIVLCGLPCCVHPESGAGPGPLLFRGHQPRLDRTSLDIPDHFIQLSRRTDPVIVGFVLPKRLPVASEDANGNPAGPALQPTHNGRHRDMRLPHCVHVVRHDRPGVEIIGTANGPAIFDGILNYSGDTRIPQPERPRTASVEPLVANAKRSSSCVFGREHLGRDWGVGTGQAPGYKDNASIRKPMRKVAAIKHIKYPRVDRPQKTMVCPTAKILTQI